MTGSPPTTGDRTRRFFGALLMAVGGLIATLCGLCTLVWTVSWASSLGGAFMPGSRVGGALGLLLVTAFVGGIPIAFGVLIFRLGRRMYRQP